MRDRGVKLIYGRWLIEGAPRVLLFDTGSCYDRLDEWKTDLWNLAGIPSPPNDHETNEAIVFGYIVAWFLGEVSLLVPGGSSALPVAIHTSPSLPSHTYYHTHTHLLSPLESNTVFQSSYTPLPHPSLPLPRLHFVPQTHTDPPSSPAERPTLRSSPTSTNGKPVSPLPYVERGTSTSLLSSPLTLLC